MLNQSGLPCHMPPCRGLAHVGTAGNGRAHPLGQRAALARSLCLKAASRSPEVAEGAQPAADSGSNGASRSCGKAGSDALASLTKVPTCFCSASQHVCSKGLTR